ncbi:hypothetical protein BS47DRAFT_1217505 [Hydnum rufescens UP504]|uniref:Uncharacterized protein n=1 Tax=Hydnum rufescens UP504 TaxID=1448309 RepID=A0A9P6AS93_9AGAM|nr:hypothetical protein BS47DRAFT_1217505 [Hydnum rufescens UP504]
MASVTDGSRGNWRLISVCSKCRGATSEGCGMQETTSTRSPIFSFHLFPPGHPPFIVELSVLPHTPAISLLWLPTAFHLVEVGDTPPKPTYSTTKDSSLGHTMGILYIAIEAKPCVETALQP